MDFKKYENKVPYPKKPVKPRLNSNTPSVHEIKKYQDDRDAFDIQETDFKLARKKWEEEISHLHDLFKQDLFDELGLENHPLKDKIFSYAWEKGHSGGFNDVYCVAEDLVEFLFKDEVK